MVDKIVVVIEGRSDLRGELVECVRRMGFIAIPAADLESGVVIVRKLPVDLILVDSPPDDITGISQIAELKKRRREARVVVITDWHPMGEGLFRSAGCDEICYKPVAMADLEERIRRLLRWPAPTTPAVDPESSRH